MSSSAHNLNSSKEYSENETPIVKLQYKKGDVIFFEGDLDSHFFIIETGTVQIYGKSKKGRRINICTIGDGESFGEFALIDKKPRSATAEALSDLTVIRVSEEGFRTLVEELPGWALSMLKSFTVRIKSMTDLIKDFEEIFSKRSSNLENAEEPKKPIVTNADLKPPPLPKPAKAVPLVSDAQTSDFFVDLGVTNNKIHCHPV